MTAGSGVDVLAVLDRVIAARDWWTADWNAGGGNDSPKSALAHFVDAANGAEDARAAIAELLAADKEYDEARALACDLTRTDAMQRDADIEYFEQVTARRASALAALESQP